MATIPVVSGGLDSGLVYGGTPGPWNPFSCSFGKGNGARPVPSRDS